MTQIASRIRRWAEETANRGILLKWVVPILCAVYLGIAATHDFVDTGVYVAGGKAMLRREPLYDLRVAPLGLPFTYPPFAALVFAPLAVAPQRVVQVLWTLGSIGLLYLIIARSLEHFGGWAREGAARWVLPIALLAEPVRNNLGLGQINFMLAFLVLWDLTRSDRARFKGVAVGIAAAMKLTPLFFIAYMAVTRPLSAARNALISFVLAGALAFGLAPEDSLRFWHGFFLDAQRVGGIAYISNQSLFALVLRLVEEPRTTQLIWYCMTATVCVLFFLFAWRFRATQRRAIDAIACAMPLLCSPVSWTHHWIFALPLIVVGLRLGRDLGRRDLVWPAYGLIASMLGGLVWLAPNEAGREFHLGPLEFVIGHSYLITATLAVCATVMMVLLTDADRAGHADPCSRQIATRDETE